MFSIKCQPLFTKARFATELGDHANPYIVHWNIDWKGQGAGKNFAVECHTAAKVSISIKIS